MAQDPGFFWYWQMAWRDSRVNLNRLLLFVSSIVLGVAALVAINSFGNNLKQDIDNESKELLGADLQISGRQVPNAEVQAILDSVESLSSEQAREVSFSSMVYYPEKDKTRLANIRALEGGYPFYGSLETEPLGAGSGFQTRETSVVDQTIMLQFEADPGDSIRVGVKSFAIQGSLLKAPGQNSIASTVAPKVYIALKYLDETELVKPGSRLRYRYYFQFPGGFEVDELAQSIRKRLQDQEYGVETVAMRKERLGDAFDFLTSFLNLVAFVALLLGCVGVASAVQIYIKEKISTVAVLRCLGATGNQALWIYLLQICVMGLGGSILGAALGSGLQVLLPTVLKSFLPLEVSYSVSWAAVGQGVLTGMIISLLFALLPLIRVRKISPLRVLRAAFEEKGRKMDIPAGLIYGLIGVFIYGFSYAQLQDYWEALYFSGFLLLAFLILAGAARLLMFLVRKYFPVSWSFIWRQSLANLYRPNNQTATLITTIGLGTALLSTLYFVQSVLLGQVALTDRYNQPNMILFDIQTDQTEEVAQMVRSYGMPIKQDLPIVAMRLAQFKGKSRAELLKDSILDLPRDVINREYRVTYRDTLDINEELVEGELKPAGQSLDDPVYVSISDNHLRRMKAKLGDTIVFNVQGTPITTIIGSVRRLDIKQFRTSFTFVFPRGVLEEAPQFGVLVTRVNSNEESARFQQEIVAKYPNISVVDISLILKTAEEILGEVAFVIQFMALFSILTGIIVLIGSVLLSRFQRIRESILLRTLGANRRQIIRITLLEYFFLGSLASLAGIILSLVASWALMNFTFGLDFNPDYTPIFWIYLIITGLTVFIGVSSSRGILSRPPLEVLRAEVQ